jgi:hypothetical protein
MQSFQKPVVSSFLCSKGAGYSSSLGTIGLMKAVDTFDSTRRALLHLCQPVHRKPDLLCIPAGRVVLAPLSVAAGSAMNIFFLLPGQEGAYKYRKV